MAVTEYRTSYTQHSFASKSERQNFFFVISGCKKYKLLDNLICLMVHQVFHLKTSFCRRVFTDPPYYYIVLHNPNNAMST